MTLPTLLLITGLFLILAEALLPSGGILATLSVVALATSIGFAFRVSNDVGLNFLGFTAVSVPVVVVGGMKLLPRTPWGKKSIPQGLSFDSSAGIDPYFETLRGQRGVLEADCRPAGIARFDGRRVDVVSRGEWVKAGETVEVCEVQGNRVIVRGLGQEESSS